jgi:hypothetical protein
MFSKVERAVRGAVLDVLGDVGHDLVPLQMFGQGFIPSLARPANVALDHNAGFLDRLGQAFGGIGRGAVVAQVQLQLVRIVDVSDK